MTLEELRLKTGDRLDFDNNSKYQFANIKYRLGYYNGLVNSSTKQEEGVG